MPPSGVMGGTSALSGKAVVNGTKNLICGDFFLARRIN